MIRENETRRGAGYVSFWNQISLGREVKQKITILETQKSEQPVLSVGTLKPKLSRCPLPAGQLYETPLQAINQFGKS